jgi:hypothetical protein
MSEEQTFRSEVNGSVPYESSLVPVVPQVPVVPNVLNGLNSLNVLNVVFTNSRFAPRSGPVGLTAESGFNGLAMPGALQRFRNGKWISAIVDLDQLPVAVAVVAQSGETARIDMEGAVIV